MSTLSIPSSMKTPCAGNREALSNTCNEEAGIALVGVHSEYPRWAIHFARYTHYVPIHSVQRKLRFPPAQLSLKTKDREMRMRMRPFNPLSNINPQSSYTHIYTYVRNKAHFFFSAFRNTNPNYLRRWALLNRWTNGWTASRKIPPMDVIWDSGRILCLHNVESYS